MIDGEWYVDYVITGVNMGIVQGYSDGTYRPAEGVRRSEFLKMLSKTFSLEEDLPYSFFDVDNTWVDKYAGIVEKYNLFPGIGNNLEFGKYMTRDEVAIAMYQFLEGK